MKDKRDNKLIRIKQTGSALEEWKRACRERKDRERQTKLDGYLVIKRLLLNANRLSGTWETV